MKRTLGIIDRITLWLGYVAAAAVVLMMVHVTLDVILDVLFNRPLPATLVIVSNYYMPLVTFLPLAFVERLDKHVKVDVATQYMPLVAQRHLFGWTFVLCMVICGMLAYATWIEAVSKYRIGAFVLERGTPVPTWPVRFAAPLSYGLLTVLFLFKFVAYVLGSDVLQRERPRFGVFGQFGGSKE
jgi:TRAP-type C4-dicarboxylate transport system permease small subunit